MATCRDCGEEIKFIQDWRGRWYPCDIVPDEYQKPIYIEERQGEFTKEYRHNCEGRPVVKRRAF